MKVFDRVKSTLVSIRKSIRRFPITVFVSTVLTILVIYINESHLIGDNREILEKIKLVVGLGIPLSLCIGLLIERFFKNEKIISFLLYSIGAGYLILYYFVYLKNLEMVSMSRYIATMLFLVLSFLYIPRLGKRNNYEYYLMDIWSGFALTFVYSFVLYFGIAAIFFTIDQLFNVNIKGEFYYYMFLTVSLIFAMSLFLSKFPAIDEEYDNVEYTKSLKILLTYIVIPLITVYTVILYIYFGKILITKEWPRGLVSHLVLWYSTLSVGVIFLITPILKQNKTAKLFKVLFPKIILPILFMMFMSIYQRIAQYGITENRYYVVVLGLWVLGIMIYFSLKNPLKNIVIPISLSLVILNSAYGPFSSFTISKYSQNNRLERILARNNMLSGEKITKNSETPLQDKREISNILSYFNSNHKLEDIRVLPKDFDLNKMETVMGFKYEPYYAYPYEQNRYFYYQTHNAEDTVNIKEYDYYIRMNSWNENKREVAGLTLQYNRLENTLIISEENIVLHEQDMLLIVKEIYKEQEAKHPNENKSMMNYEEMSYEIAPLDIEEDIKLKFIFNEINGRVDESNNIIVESIDFILLISDK